VSLECVVRPARRGLLEIRELRGPWERRGRSEQLAIPDILDWLVRPVPLVQPELRVLAARLGCRVVPV